MAQAIPTRCLVLSDTHGESLLHKIRQKFDIVMHAGDLTEESKLEEFQTTIQLLRDIQAPLKLVIPGNHDWTLDGNTFARKISEMNPTAEDLTLVEQIYGRFGEAKALFDRERENGIFLLDEGIHRFELANGAVLTIYASPFTQSANDWGFNYLPNEDHLWEIENVDVAMTHSPPSGLLDRTGSGQRAGSSSLFAAVAQAKPQMHCFGHIHESWGSRLVQWKEELGEPISHFTAIDNEKSTTIETLSSLQPRKFDESHDLEMKRRKWEEYDERGYSVVDTKIEPGKQTLFVNAAIEGAEEGQQYWPWVVELQLRSEAGLR